VAPPLPPPRRPPRCCHDSLFLVGIGSTFKLHTIRYALIGVGSLLLILATVLILQQPGLPS
jgi:hypothetical protein